ncbi:S-layer protein [Candidatus Micrarchaeota archaeon]|nr:S-layer protein [Candidatus Micrarchaeota archaeon]
MKLVDEDKALEARVISPDAFQALSPDRLKILSLLSKQSMHSADIARTLKMHDQTVYYHMKLLKRFGLVKQTGLEEKQGALAKKYECTTDALGIVIKNDWKTYRPKTASAPDFLKPFISKNKFDGFFVVGSPDPHGKYRARGSEFCALELSAYIAQYSAVSYPAYLLDTEVREEHKKNNLILIGGPKVNTLVSEVNDFLPIKFKKDSFEIYSTLSKKTYGENVGFIESIENPFNPDKKILVIAGNNHVSTRVAILAVFKNRLDLEKGNSFKNEEFAKVVQGFDEDGDGIIDVVEILE